MLKYRNRQQITLPFELSEWLKKYSEDSKTPITTITENALNDLRAKIEKEERI